MIPPSPADLLPLARDACRRDQAAINALADLLADRGAQDIAAVLGFIVGVPQSTGEQMRLVDFARSRPFQPRVRKALTFGFARMLGKPRNDETLILADLCRYTSRELLDGIKNFGVTSLAELRVALAELGLHLAADPD